jgi:hypothetical protein
MRGRLTILAVGILVLASVVGGADDPKKGKTVEELYPVLKGDWVSADKKATLTRFQLGKYEKKPADFASEWHIGLVFTPGDGQGYYGPAEKVEADGDGLKITLPPPGKDDKRQTRILTVKRDEDKLEVRLLDGPFKGTWKLAQQAGKK